MEPQPRDQDSEVVGPGPQLHQDLSSMHVESQSRPQEEVFPLMELPQEVRGHIFNFFPQHTILSLRLVCKQWKADIDEYYNFDGTINDERPSWDKVFQLRLRTCKVIRFLKNPPTYNELPGTKMFKYPQLIQKLDLRTVQISFENFYFILADYGSNLQELCLKLSYPILNEMNYSASFETFNFSHLVRLELIVSTIGDTDVDRLESRTVIQERMFTELMSNSTMISLQYLKIELQLMGFSTVSKVLSRVFGFLALNALRNPGLKTLDFELIQGHHGLPSFVTQSLNETDLAVINLKQLYQLNEVQELRVISSSAVGIDIWIEIIKRQSKLQSFEVDILPASQSLFTTVLGNNFETLVQLEITDLTIWVGEDGDQPIPFDLSVLQNCNALKKLFLDRNVLARRRYETVELMNLILLPSSINELALNYFNVLTNDFYLYFSSLAMHSQCSQLRNVTITQCGNSNEYGINGSTLEMLLTVESVFFVEISIFNFGTDENDEERIKLNRILTSYGYNENHSYFQCSNIQSILAVIDNEMNE